MGYRHLTSDELDALCNEYEVLRNLRDAGRDLHHPRHRFPCPDVDHCLSSHFYFTKQHRSLWFIIIHGAEFHEAQRNYHTTARVLAGLKPYR